MKQLIASVLLAVSVALACLPARCNARPDGNSTNLIVGGFKVSVEDVPYQVGVFRDGRFTCGGTIVGPFWVLTAQHCTPDTKAYRYAVVVGVDIPANGQRLPLAEVYLPPDNDDHSTFDVALLKLEHKLQYGARVACVPLMSSNEKVRSGTPAYISGYGMTLSRSLDTELRAAVVGVLPHEQCTEFYKEQAKQYMFCAGFERGEVDTCQGDSGGPLVVEGELAGVTDWGQGCARAHAPGVYMAVSSFYDWVQMVVQKQRTSDERILCAPKNPKKYQN